MIELGYVFTIFFLTLGPIKTIPAFHVLTREADPKDLRDLAARTALVATVICVIIALVMCGTLHAWRVSPDAMRIAGSILLFIAALQSIAGFLQPPPAPKAALTDRKQLFGLAVTPLAIPIIITPWGVAAILMFTSIARGDAADTRFILAVLLAVMLLNYLGMLVARRITTLVGVGSFQILGWIFAVMQAGLATEGVIISLRNLGMIPAFAQ